ncbi:MAG: hypothetical protein PHY42_07045 [Bacilli bacterium]|nr:hypothetical protein [Bacilli bacterium]
MKGLLKFLFGIIVFVVITVGIPLGISYYYLVDNVDESPLELYEDTVTFDSELTALFNESLNLTDKTSIDFTFTEDELNKLIFALIRNSGNPNFNPNSEDEANKYLYTFDLADLNTGVEFLNGKKIYVKNIYAKIENDQLYLFLTFSALGVNSRAKVSVSFEENIDAYKMIFKTLGVGKANMLSGFGSEIMMKVLDQLEFSENTFNDVFEQENLPFEIDFADFSVSIDKTKLQMLVQQLINPEDMADSSEKEILQEFVATLSSKDNDLVNFGIIGGDEFGIQFELTKFMVDPSMMVLDPSVTTFDETTFIMNKVQGFIISNLVSTADSKMSFSNSDFNAIVYDQSSAYSAFQLSIPIPNSTSTFAMNIEGILVDFNTNDVAFRINADLNGLPTSILITGTITENDGPTIRIVIDDTISLGQDGAEVLGDYIIAESSLIISMLGNNIQDMGIMQYDSLTTSFVMTAASYEQMMKVEGTNEAPLTVNKLKIVEDAIEVYCTASPTDPFFNALTQATDAIETAITNTDLAAGDFVATTPEEQQAVTDLLNALDTVTDGLTGGTLTEEDTSALIGSINELSPENQQILLDNLEDNAASADLIALYDSLFGLN